MAAAGVGRRFYAQAFGVRMYLIRRLIIRGRVQGVGFRAWTEAMALELGIEGWVRNRLDGSVEALFAGPQERVLTIIVMCREGPPGAVVKGVDEQRASDDELQLRRRGELFSVLASA
jgi:acylphosphatase